MRYLAALFLLCLSNAWATPHDGHIFDHGHGMSQRNPRAHPMLDRMQRLRGQWSLLVVRHLRGGGQVESAGQAEIAWMNRGYALMERRHVDRYDEDGNSADVIGFLTYTPSASQWGLGEADGYSENVRMFNGVATEDGLELHDALRRAGSVRLIYFRLNYRFSGNDAFRVVLERSSDEKKWFPLEERRYKRLPEQKDFMPVSANFGSPNSDRAPESAQFDFLVGKHKAEHSILRGDRWVELTATATAVHALDGRAILEHMWCDMDQEVPDSASSIVRIYNRAERRWESLYLDNEDNALLYFGGQQEGDRMVLHRFVTQRSDQIARYVFHDVRAGSYDWYAESSADRGRSFNKIWTIRVSPPSAIEEREASSDEAN